MLSFICTVPDDIPLHPGAPDYVDQGQEPGDCIVTSSFTLIAEHQRVLAAKSRSVSSKEKIRHQEKIKNMKTRKVKQVHHPRSKMARNAWVEKNDTETGQDTTSFVNEKAVSDSRHTYLSYSEPPTTSISSAPLSTSSTGVDALDDDIVRGPANEKATPSVTDIASDPVPAEMLATSASTCSQSPILPNATQGGEVPLGDVRGPKTGAMVILLNMISPAPAPAEETVLQPVYAPIQISANTLKNKSEKALLGKENQAVSLSVSGPVVPSRRSQRILKRKRGGNEGTDIVDR